MSPIVASAVLACLASAPRFTDLSNRIEGLGFKEAARQSRDVRWADAEGTEVFLSSIPGQFVCSVWFDGSMADEIAGVSELLGENGFTTRRLTDDDTGPSWLVGTNWFMRLVFKQGNESRLGAALFVLRN